MLTPTYQTVLCQNRNKISMRKKNVHFFGIKLLRTKGQWFLSEGIVHIAGNICVRTKSVRPIWFIKTGRRTQVNTTLLPNAERKTIPWSDVWHCGGWCIMTKRYGETSCLHSFPEGIFLRNIATCISTRYHIGVTWGWKGGGANVRPIFFQPRNFFGNETE
jgi:hypothetical protein